MSAWEEGGCRAGHGIGPDHAACATGPSMRGAARHHMREGTASGHAGWGLAFNVAPQHSGDGLRRCRVHYRTNLPASRAPLWVHYRRPAGHCGHERGAPKPMCSPTCSPMGSSM